MASECKAIAEHQGSLVSLARVCLLVCAQQCVLVYMQPHVRHRMVGSPLGARRHLGGLQLRSYLHVHAWRSTSPLTLHRSR